MTELIDANVIVRYLMDEPPAMAEIAATLIEGPRQLTVSPLILAEAGFVLTKVYGRDRSKVVTLLIELIQRSNVSIHQMDTETAVEALEYCRPSARVSFADALLWAEARAVGGAVHTFDRRFPGEGITLISH
jgi:predicted nucleic acid-binding protein